MSFSLHLLSGYDFFVGYKKKEIEIWKNVKTG